MSDLQKLIQGKIKTVSRAGSRLPVLTIEIDSLSGRARRPFMIREVVLNAFGHRFPVPFTILTK